MNRDSEQSIFSMEFPALGNLIPVTCRCIVANRIIGFFCRTIDAVFIKAIKRLLTFGTVEERAGYMIWLAVVAALLVVKGIIFNSKVNITLHIERHGNNDRILVRVRLMFGLIRYTYEVPSIQFKNYLQGAEVKVKEEQDAWGKQQAKVNRMKVDADKMLHIFERARIVLEQTISLTSWVRQTLTHFHCTELRWKTSVGLDDAADTAITTGLTWGLKTSMLGLIFRYVRLDTRPQLDVLPAYHQQQFTTDLTATIHTKVWWFVVATVRLLRRMRKLKLTKKGWKKMLVPRA